MNYLQNLFDLKIGNFFYEIFNSKKILLFIDNLIMVNEYCVVCRCRIEKKIEGYKIEDFQMINKINSVRKFILKTKKITADLEIAKLGDFLHKTCHCKINYQIAKMKNIEVSESTTPVELFNQNVQFDLEVQEVQKSQEVQESQEIQESQEVQESQEYSICSIQSEILSTSTLTLNTNILQKIEVKLNKGYSSHKICFVCKKSKNKMAVIHSQSRYDIFAKLNIFIVKGSRICTQHLDEKGFINPDYLKLIESINGTVLFDEESIQELIDNFQTVRNSSQLMSQFGESSPIENNTLNLTGLKKEEFLYLAEYIKYKMNDSNTRTIEQALFVYLLWLRNGMTMEVVFYNAKLKCY